MTKKKSTTRRVGTITFQPDDDIKAEIERLVKKLGGGRGVQSKLVNEALRLKLSAAGTMLGELEKAQEQVRRKAKGE